MSDIIYTPPASSGGTTINPTNNFIPKRSNATTFVDSVLENGSNYLYSNYGGYTGLGLDFLNFVSYLGDWNNLINGTTLVINDQTSNIFTKYNASVQGINLDFTNNSYLFGNISNGFLNIDANNQYVTINVGGSQYFLLDKLNEIGSFFDYPNGTGLEFSLINKTFYSIIGNENVLYANYASGFIQLGKGALQLTCDYNTQILRIGDVTGVGNNNELVIDDNAEVFTFVTESLVFSGTALQDASSGGFANTHLVITLNGNQYKIKLENP